MISAVEEVVENPTLKMNNENPWDLFSKANNAFKENHYEEASELYSKVLENLVPLVGQFAKELGPVYIAYGKCLIQIGIENKDGLLNEEILPEGDLLIDQGSGKKRKILELDEDEKEEVEEEIEEATEDKVEGDDKVEQPQEGSEDQNTDEGDEFELAWEILDVARIIYSDTPEDPNSISSLSEVYYCLGDISMEIENFRQAAEEYYKSIEMKQKERANNQERDLASLYFKYSMALEYDGRAKEAVQPLEKAKQLLINRLTSLNGDDEKGKSKLTKESDELESLIPEVDMKLEDLKCQLTGKKMTLKEEVESTINAAAIGVVQDLSGLVKKRSPN